jgi:hypothetical protein
VEIDSRFVGVKIGPYETVLHWQDLMVYAAGVEDRNSLYFDDEREGGILAHPLYPLVATRPVLQHLHKHLQAPDFPFELLAAQSHYGEHLILHRSLRPGTELTVTGEIAAMVSDPAGTHLVIALNGTDGEERPLFTRHTTRRLKGVRLTGEERGREQLPSTPKAPEPGDILWQAVVSIGRLRPYIYAGCTSISSPQHLSPNLAHQLGLPGVVLQESATLAFALREILYREAEGEPRGLETLACRFTGFVLPDTEIRIQLLGKNPHAERTDLYFVVLDHQGRRAISDGYASVRREGLIP